MTPNLGWGYSSNYKNLHGILGVNNVYEFIRLTSKAIADIGKVVNWQAGNSHEKELAPQKQYGGFIPDDWEKVGLDMKRGLISYGRGKV